MQGMIWYVPHGTRYCSRHFWLELLNYVILGLHKHPHNSMPYVHIGLMITLYNRILLSKYNVDSFSVIRTFFHFGTQSFLYDFPCHLPSRWSLVYRAPSPCGILTLLRSTCGILVVSKYVYISVHVFYILVNVLAVFSGAVVVLPCVSGIRTCSEVLTWTLKQDWFLSFVKSPSRHKKFHYISWYLFSVTIIQKNITYI